MKFLFSIILLVSACSEDNSTDPAPTPSNDIDWGTEAKITEEIGDESYVDWPAEDAVHDSTGPHGKVRTFMNTTLNDSLTAGNTTHPVGSVAVKELYEADGTTIKGYAVETKISAGATGDSWYWYENFLNTTEVDFKGAGLSVCTSCHSNGSDFVTTEAL